MTVTRLLFAVLAIGLTGLILWAVSADGRSLPAVSSSLIAAPWALVALADLYVGFTISAAFILLAERRLWVGLVWALPIFVLGNVWSALWLIVRLKRLAGLLRV